MWLKSGEISRGAVRQIHSKVVAGLFLLILPLGSISYAQTSPTFNIEVVGQVGGGCHGVQSDVTYAYIGEGPNFTVLDTTVASGPVVVKRMRFHGTIGDVYVDGNTAYAAGWSAGLVILDISDPTSPVIVGIHDVAAYKVVVYEGHAYVPRLWGGVEIVDVSDPASPTLTVAIDWTGFVENVWVDNDTAYFSAGLLGIHEVDVSTPSAPAYLGTHSQAEGALDVVTSGSLGYVAGSDFYIVDFDRVGTDSLIGTVEIDGYGRAVFLDEETVYVATSSGTIYVVDVTSPTAPLELASWHGTLLPIDIYVVDDTLFICDAHRGLYMYDVTDPSDPVKTGFYPTPIGVHVVRIPSASKAYLAAYDFYAIEINDPENPEVYSIYETEEEIAGCDISGNLAYLCHDKLRDLMILNIGDPASPTLVSIYEPELEEAAATAADWMPSALREADDDTTKVYKYPESTLPKADVRGNKGITTGLTSGSLEMLDVGDPSSVTRHSLYPMEGFVGDIDIQGNTAYICNGSSGVHVLNINDASSPTMLGTFKEAWALSFHLSDISAQVGDGGEGVWLVDMSDPSSPTMRHRIMCPGPTHGVDENGYLMYTASGSQGLHVVDISDNGTTPTITGHFDSEGLAIDVRYHGGLIYLADRYTGLWILRYTGPRPNTGGNTAANRPHWRLYR